MNEELKTMLGNTITIGQTTYPVAHMRYTGTSKTFVVWTIINESPALVGDDEDLYSVVQVDIDIYSDGNYRTLEKALKSLFKINNWVWTESSAEMYEDDTGLYHKTLTFEKESDLWQE